MIVIFIRFRVYQALASRLAVLFQRAAVTTAGPHLLFVCVLVVRRMLGASSWITSMLLQLVHGPVDHAWTAVFKIVLAVVK